MGKYKTTEYISEYAYTPYDKNDKVPNSSFVSNIPDVLETELGDIQIYDEDSAFAPQVDVYSEFVVLKSWKHDKKSDWYTHIQTGIKVKLEIIRSHALDYKNPGDGWENRTLTVKIPIPSERGKNPNSHNNRTIPGLISKDVRLTEEQWQTVAKMGNGKGYSQGVRNLLADLEML